MNASSNVPNFKYSTLNPKSHKICGKTRPKTTKNKHGKSFKFGTRRNGSESSRGGSTFKRSIRPSSGKRRSPSGPKRSPSDAKRSPSNKTKPSEVSYGLHGVQEALKNKINVGKTKRRTPSAKDEVKFNRELFRTKLKNVSRSGSRNAKKSSRPASVSVYYLNCIVLLCQKVNEEITFKRSSAYD